MITSILHTSKLYLVLIVATVAVAFSFSASKADASYVNNCYSYSYSHGGAGCSWQGLYNNRWGLCSVYRAVNEYGHFGQIFSMTAPCTRS